MTIRDIAGFCPEKAIWQMLADMGDALTASATVVIPGEDSIVVDGEHFLLDGSACDTDTTDTTDTADLVWALGAMACYMATGHTVFGGHGRDYQLAHPGVALPVMPKDYSALTPVVQRCMQYAKEQRMTLPELRETARQGLARCAKVARRPAKAASDRHEKRTDDNNADRWPEEMTAR